MWWHLTLLVVVTLAIYGNSLQNGFVSDDDFQILGNRWITDYRNIPRLFSSNVWAFAQSETTNYYRPLFMLLYMAEYYLFGFDPLLWHAANLVLHMAALVASYFLVRALGGEKLALVAGLWFALHPIHVEAVVWVAVLTDLLCGLTLFAGTYCYHRARNGERPWLFYAMSSLAFFAGLLIKETAFVFPALLVAYEYFYRRESLSSILRGSLRYLPYVVVFTAYASMRLHALGRFAPTAGKYFKLTPWEMFLSVPVLFAQYVWKLFAPVNLNYYYVYEPIRAVGWKPLAAMLLMAAMVVLMFWLRSRQPLLAFSMAWFFLTLAPVLSIPNVGENVFTERYLYIPSLGFCIMAGWGWLQLRERATTPNARHVLSVALAALFLFYAVQTIRRNPDWNSDLRLFSKTAEQSPHSPTIQMNLGYIYFLHGRVDEAIEYYRRSLALDADRPLTHNNMGNALSQKGQYDEALAHLRRAIELKPDYHGAWLNLGLVFSYRKEWDRAIECYSKAVEIEPKFNEAWTAMGLAYWNKGQPQPAVSAYRKAIALKPEYVEARINLASALSETGSSDEAIEQLLAALQTNPGGPYSSVILFNLGINYERKQQWNAALRAYEQALVANPQFVQARQKIDFLRARIAPQPQPSSLPPIVPRP